MAWSDDAEELKHIKNDVGSQLASMECVPRHNTIDCPTLYWAAIPGNAADFPAEESFHTFIEQAVCLFTEETNYRSSLSPFGIKMVDRLTGKPLHLDISDLPMKRGITTNRNKFVLGPSGSGKSFFMNHLVRQYYEQGAHVVLVDTGNSYQGLCGMIRRKTGGADGVYFTYTEDKPISFNPFYTDDYIFDVEKKDSIKTLLLTLWKSEDDKVTKTESGELGSAVSAILSASNPTVASCRRSTPSTSICVTTTARNWHSVTSRWRSPTSTSTTCSPPCGSITGAGVTISCSTPRRTSTCSASGSSSSR